MTTSPIGLTYLEMCRREKRRANIKTALAFVAIVAAFAIVGQWDTTAAKIEAQRVADRALNAIATSAPVHGRVNSLAFCKAPREGQVLVMRPDPESPRGYACTTYEKYDWPNVAQRVQ